MLQQGDSSYAAVEIVNAISFTQEYIRNSVSELLSEMKRPFILLKPRLYLDGNQWCCIYGAEFPEGVIAWGDSPEQASRNFDIEWIKRATR